MSPFKAVGSEFEVNINSKSKVSHEHKPRTRTIQLKHRPTECALCPVVGGIHAMHLLYDKDGPDGRPVLLAENKEKNLPERVAFVHSLCAMFICSYPQTKGCVYGCHEDGTFDEEQDDYNSDTEDDDDSKGDEPMYSSSDSNDETDKEEIGLTPSPHHFAIEHKRSGEDNNWTLRIKALRRDLKCFICGLVDKGSTRIAVQVRNVNNLTQCFVHS